MALDFSPITTAPNYAAEVKTVDVSGKKKAKLIYLLLIIPIFWIPLLIYALMKSPAGIEQQKQRTAALKAFAAANGFEYEAARTLELSDVKKAAFGNPFTAAKEAMKNTEPRPESGIILPYDTTVRQIDNKMSGSSRGMPFEYLNADVELHHYHGVTSGDGLPMRGMNIFRIQLPVSLPNVFANSKFNDIKGFDASVKIAENMEKHVLEGDFPNYYEVRAQSGTQIDVLSVLSPDVMRALVSNFHYDLWNHGTELMLIANGTEVEYFAATPLVFKNVEVLLDGIDRIARALRGQAS